MRHLTRAPGMLIRKENAASLIWLRFLAGPPAKSDVAVLAGVASSAPSSCEDVASRVRQAINEPYCGNRQKCPSSTKTIFLVDQVQVYRLLARSKHIEIFLAAERRVASGD